MTACQNRSSEDRVHAEVSDDLREISQYPKQQVKNINARHSHEFNKTEFRAIYQFHISTFQGLTKNSLKRMLQNQGSFYQDKGEFNEDHFRTMFN